MNLLLFLFIGLPLFFLIAFFVGIIKRNRRIWLTSLILFIVIVLAELALIIPINKIESFSSQSTSSQKL